MEQPPEDITGGQNFDAKSRIEGDMNNRRTDKTRREPEEPVCDESVLDEAKKESDGNWQGSERGSKAECLEFIEAKTTS